MKNFKALVIGAGVAAANLLTSASTLFRGGRCAGSCGSCNYACVPAVFAFLGVGGLVVAYRKFKIKFQQKRG